VEDHGRRKLIIARSGRHEASQRQNHFPDYVEFRQEKMFRTVLQRENRQNLPKSSPLKKSGRSDRI